MIEAVCTLFDYIGVLLRLKYIDEELLFRQFYDVVIKCWIKLKDLIKFEREPERKAETYMEDFEYLYERAKEYKRSRNVHDFVVHPKDILKN